MEWDAEVLSDDENLWFGHFLDRDLPLSYIVKQDSLNP